MYKEIIEGKVKLKIPKEAEKKISKKLSVFYNPLMELNRDISIAILNTYFNNKNKSLLKKEKQDLKKNKKINIALPLAGTGVRALRILKEFDNIDQIYVNDFDKESIKLIKENLKINNFDKSKKIIISHNDANAFFEQNRGFDYIDIDPFGSPVPFLDSAIRHLSRGSILAVTATDTGALSGTYEKACYRRYNSKPLLISQMHEIGIRILIKKVQEIGAIHEKALTPIYSYSKNHYMRIFFLCKKGKKKCDEILKEHQFFNYNSNTGDFQKSKLNFDKNFNEFAGKLWIGKLKDNKIAKNIKDFIENNMKNKKQDLKFLKQVDEELDVFGFYDLHTIAKKNKLKIPKFVDLKDKIKFTRTHFNKYGIKTKLNFKDLIKVLK